MRPQERSPQWQVRPNEIKFCKLENFARLAGV